MDEFLFNIGGVTEHARYAQDGQKNMLRIFSLFVLIALVFGFICFFLPFYLNFNLIAGIVAGSIWAALVLAMDRLLFDSVGISSIAIRILVIVLTSYITSLAFGFGLANESVQNEMYVQSGVDNRVNSDEIFQIRNEYESKIKMQQDKMVEMAEKEPLNSSIQRVLREIISDLEEERDERIKEVKTFINEKNVNTSFGSKLIAYWNMSDDKKFGGALKLILIIELLPMIIRMIYFFSYEND